MLAQVGGPPPLAVSWSASSPELRHRVRQIFDAFVALGLQLQQLEQPQPTSQFEHYRRLCKAHALDPPVWVLFTDDDDLWSERRALIYRRQIVAAAERTPFAVSLLCRRKAVLRSGSAEAEDPDAVRALLREGRARLADSNLKDGIAADDHNMAEYFDLAVRHTPLQQFFESVPPFVTRHRLCDLGFCLLMTKQSECVRFLPDDGDFVYFYSRGERPEGASGTTVDDAEIDLAQAAFERADAALRALFLTQAGPDRYQQHVMGLVASLRQGIEQEMVMLRVGGPVLPVDLVDSACAHHARKAVDSWLMSYPGYGREAAPLRALLVWATALARGALRERMLRLFEVEALVCRASWQVTRLVPTARTSDTILIEVCGARPPSEPRGCRVGPWSGAVSRGTTYVAVHAGIRALAH